MILIADSGSTKCNWALCNKKTEIVQEFTTLGFNPYFIDSKKIIKYLEKSTLEKYKSKIKNVFFYGAGCSSPSKNKIIRPTQRLAYTGAGKRGRETDEDGRRLIKTRTHHLRERW